MVYAIKCHQMSYSNNHENRESCDFAVFENFDSPLSFLIKVECIFVLRPGNKWVIWILDFSNCFYGFYCQNLELAKQINNWGFSKDPLRSGNPFVYRSLRRTEFPLSVMQNLRLICGYKYDFLGFLLGNFRVFWSLIIDLLLMTNK